MIKAKFIAPLIISFFAFSVVMGVNSESLFEAQGTSGTFTNENPPSYIFSNPDQTYFFEFDSISYVNWTIDVFLEDNSFITLTSSDFAEFILFSPSEGTPLSPSDTSVEVTFLNPVGDNLTESVFITVEPDFCTANPTDPLCYSPNYSLVFFAYPTQTTYFVGDTLDLSGLEVDLYDDGLNMATLFYDSADVSFTSINTSLPIFHGDVLTADDTQILFSYDDSTYMGFGASESFLLTIYDQPNYAFDFDSDSYVISDNILHAERSLETFGSMGDEWLLKASQEQNEPISLTQGVSGEGLIFIENNTFSNFEVSMLSNHLWGMEGMASTPFITPIIQSIYIKAYAPNGGTAVSVTVNGANILSSNSSFLASSEPSVNDWIIFPVFDAPLSLDASVGHLEIIFTNLMGGPVYFQALRVVSSDDDGDPFDDSILNLMTLARDMEALDSCVDQSSFIQTNETIYNGLASQPNYELILEQLLLRDAVVTGGERTELRVTMANKWEMMESRSQSEFAPPNERRWFALAVENSLPAIGWSFLTLLSLAFYFKFKLIV